MDEVCFEIGEDLPPRGGAVERLIVGGDDFVRYLDSDGIQGGGMIVSASKSYYRARCPKDSRFRGILYQHGYVGHQKMC